MTRNENRMNGRGQGKVCTGRSNGLIPAAAPGNDPTSKRDDFFGMFRADGNVWKRKKGTIEEKKNRWMSYINSTNFFIFGNGNKGG